MIEFIKISGLKDASKYVATRISENLSAGKRLVWLVPGGSGADVAVAAAEQLILHQNGGLHITLTDERYGPIEHKDSNWEQLESKGFDVNGAHLYEVLDGSTLKKNADNYSALLDRLLAEADYSIALAGLGNDGHILGIKPKSPAVDSKRGVIGYHWDDFDRLTPTLRLLRKLDEIIIYATGSQKHTQLKRLLEEDSSYEVQPAQMLKELKNVIILNDYIGKEEDYEDYRNRTGENGQPDSPQTGR